MAIPNCPDCAVEMELGADTFHAMLVVEPPDRLRRRGFFPVVAFVCPRCALLRLYSAELREPEAWAEGRFLSP